MLRLTGVLSLGLAMVLSTGCGDDDRRGGGGGGGAPVPLSSLAQELAESSCAKMFECCTEAEIMMQFEGIDPPPSTEAECATTLAGFLTIGTATWMESVSAGRLAYHDDLAGDCLAVVDALTCDAYAGGLTEEPAGAMACDQMLEPLVADGGACSQNLECINGYCEGATSDSDGVCTVLPELGEECDFDCAEGLYCEFGSPSTCVAEKADGAECTRDDECENDCVGADPSMGTAGTCGTEALCGG